MNPLPLLAQLSLPGGAISIVAIVGILLVIFIGFAVILSRYT